MLRPRHKWTRRRFQSPYCILSPDRSRLRRGCTFRQARPDCRTHTCHCRHCYNIRRPRRSPRRTRWHCCTPGHCWSCSFRWRHRLVRSNSCREPLCQPGRERRCLRGHSRCTTCMDRRRMRIRSTRPRRSCRMCRSKRCWRSNPRHCPGRSRCIPRFHPAACRWHCRQRGPPLRGRCRRPWQCRSPQRASRRSSARTRSGPWRRVPRSRDSPWSGSRRRQR